MEKRIENQLTVFEEMNNLFLFFYFSMFFAACRGRTRGFNPRIMKTKNSWKIGIILKYLNSIVDESCMCRREKKSICEKSSNCCYRNTSFADIKKITNYPALAN